MNKEALLKQRYRKEKRFQLYGLAAITLALAFLFLFIFEIFSRGYTAFQKTWLVVEINYDTELFGAKNKNPTFEEIQKLDLINSIIDI